MANRALLALLFLFMLAAVSAGCGGSESTGATSLTRKQFISKATDICKQSETEVFEHVIAYGKKHPSSEEEEMVEPVFVPITEKQLEQIKGLGLPEGDESRLKKMLDEFEAALEETKEDPGAILSPSTNPFKTFDHMAEKYGLVGCSYLP